VKRGTWAVVFIFLATIHSWAAETHAMSGLVLQVDPTHHSMIVSCRSVPGYMDAMIMPFEVRDAKSLEGIEPGTAIDFNFVVDGNTSYAKDVRAHSSENLEPEPLEAHRFGLITRLSNPAAASGILKTQQPVPDFTLIDQSGKKVTFSRLKGKVVAISFAYVRCPNPAYCFRLTNNLGQLQKRFPQLLGHDLVLLTILIDPQHEQDDAINKYAQIWHADPKTWHFLTGSLPQVQSVSRMFGMEFWSEEGFLTHTLRTVIVDREGKLYANLEGNQFTSQQLGDLVQAALNQR
jgi:protein SCO1